MGLRKFRHRFVAFRWLSVRAWCPVWMMKGAFAKGLYNNTPFDHYLVRLQGSVARNGVSTPNTLLRFMIIQS